MNISTVTPQFKQIAVPSISLGPLGNISPPQVANYYNIPASTGAGTKVGIISLGGGFQQSDLNASMTAIGLTAPNIHQVTIDGALGTFSSNLLTTAGVASLENTLDLYCVASVVPSANIVIYIGQQTVSSLANAVVAAVADGCDIVSISWATNDASYLTSAESDIQSYINQGVTILAASGDYGSEDQQQDSQELVNWPASSEYVVAVGGTKVTQDNSGNITGELADSDSGGGISKYIPCPSWQTGLTYTTITGTTNTLSTRGVPDIAVPMEGYGFYFNGSIQTGYIGTSFSCPVMAGILARYKSLLKRRFGLVTRDYFYSNKSAFTKIISGTNDASFIASGYDVTSSTWDPVTGLGSPIGSMLLAVFERSIPNSAIKYGLGVTYIDNAGTWDPLKGMWIYNADNTWHPVQTGWVAHNDGTWERIYPTPKGIFSPNTSSLGHSYYQNFPDTGSTLVVTNTGDYDLTINNVVYNDSVGNYTTNGPTFPVTITPGNSTPLTFYVSGNTIGSYSGNIQFTNYIGYLGYANATINQTVTVIPDYAAISIPSGPTSISAYLNERGITTVTIQNVGNGANLNIASITSQYGYFVVSGFTSGNIIPGASAQFYANSISTLSAGEYVDFAIVSSNANNGIPSFPIPVNITVTQLNGVQLFDNPGTYYWTVPDHLHKINYLAVGGGGSGGSGVGNYGGGGGGGGSGGYQESTSVTVTPGETLTIVVGDSGDSPTTVNATTVYPVTDPGAWGTFLNTYGVWVNPNGVDPVGIYQNMTRVWTAPVTGTYTVTASADNLVQVFIDGTLLTQSDDYTTTVSQTFSATQGDHRIYLNMLNQGGPGGVGVAIYDPSNNLIWNTRTQLNAGVGNLGENTTISGSFGTVTINGGGAGSGASSSPPYYYGDGGGTGDGGGSDSGGGGDGGGD
jgi:hypothetical protein